jgi:hypothetical protein
MKYMHITFLALLSLMAANSPSFGNHAWSENAGWLNAAATHGSLTVVPDGASGYLGGYAWAENFGWVKLGDDSGGPYANNSASDWGVNMDAAGNLSGYGWSETVGWFNFNPADSQVVVDPGSGAFSGYAWGENVGYVSFSGTSPAYGVETSPFGVGTPSSGDAWSENAGWLNFAATHGSVSVVPDGASGYLEGYAWAENFGWVKLGDDSGGPYANNSASDWGVNMDAFGNLSGYGWSETVGWFNFNPADSQVVVDPGSGAFSGYAWGENVGYVSFSGTSPAYGVETSAFGLPPLPAVTIFIFQ